ncbi:endonuclease/exonuclease/phosphatase family protein [Arthrobacter sp. ES3-54]|uniref:endonuclease/exonuclease/phosphatase family protein n=1 Tax=Arthrobacter sp. ES3-54 TaxID=1502991 RepID=UPI002405D195|nr:endonuclease/exonuclease/phosphatase family protein [Arthrobacter sp. ES3-54]
MMTTVGAQPSSAAMAYPAPAGLKSSFQSPTTVTLSWTAVAGATNYRLQRAGNSAMTGATYSSFTGTSADVRGLQPGTTYYFQVRVINSAGTGVSDYSATLAVKTKPKPVLPAISNPLRVATYNVSCDYCYARQANELPWSGRRDAVVKTVSSQRPDVLGVQEASSGRLQGDTSVAGLTQFEDLTNRLVASGVAYKLSNAKRNNCVNDTTPYQCVYQYKGASDGTKILYNSAKVDLVSQGSLKLASQTGASDRYLAWAVLRQKSTNKSFFFGNAHLIDHMSDPSYFNLRQKQAQQIVSTIAAKNTARLPVLIVGDLNSNKWTSPANAPYDILTAAGYIDPLGNTYKNDLPSSKATAEKTIRANFESFNGFSRKAPARNTYGNGTYMDYIFTSSMRTAVWENVVNIDSNGNYVGTIPSDHNMIRADVQLP